MMTSQDAFTHMKGHVAQDMQIKMNNGETFTLIQNSKGWAVFRDHKEMVEQLPFSAMAVECFIVNFGE